jgi:hypothetical protein
MEQELLHSGQNHRRFTDWSCAGLGGAFGQFHYFAVRIAAKE